MKKLRQRAYMVGDDIAHNTYILMDIDAYACMCIYTYTDAYTCTQKGLSYL